LTGCATAHCAGSGASIQPLAGRRRPGVEPAGTKAVLTRVRAAGGEQE
jgi:hypothetical protein